MTNNYSRTEPIASVRVIGAVPTPPAPPAKSRWGRWVLGGGLLAVCLVSLDLRQTLQTLHHVSIPWLLVVLTMWTGDRFLMAWKWGILLRALGVHLPFAHLIRIYYQGTASGIFLPSSIGGDLLRGYLVYQHTRATHEVYGSLLMEKIMGVLSAINWALVGTIVYTSYIRPQAVKEWIGTILVVSFVLHGLFFLSIQSRCAACARGWLARLPGGRVLAFFDRLIETYARYAAQPSALIWNWALTTAEHGLQLCIVFVMAQSLGIEADTVLFLAATTVYMFIYRLPISPDGWGLGEITAIGVYGLIGISPEHGFALALLSHVLQTIVALPGLWFLEIGKLQKIGRIFKSLRFAG